MQHIHHKTPEYLLIEQEQIEAAKKEPSKFDVLYEAYYKQIFVFVYRRIADEHTTADVVANTFLKAMLALPKYKHKGFPFSSFLFRIAQNEVNLYFRKTGRERGVSLSETDIGHIITETGENDNQEQRILLMRALATLKPQDIQLIELRFFEKRPFAEVGQILGITETHAKVRTYRLLEKLKKQLIRIGIG